MITPPEEDPYLQFIFIKDLDQIYEDEFSESLEIKINKINSVQFKRHTYKRPCHKRENLWPHCPHMVVALFHINTSRKAFICFWTRLTNLHWITRLMDRSLLTSELENNNFFYNLRWTFDDAVLSLTLCILFCSHWWRPCPSRWASGRPGTSERRKKKSTRIQLILFYCR